MNWNKVIEEGQLIYQSQNTEDDSAFRNWSLKKIQCKVSYYEVFPLNDIDRVICTIISANNGEIVETELATILGFNVKNNFDICPKRYEDTAELQLFQAMLKPVLDWGLVCKNDKNLKLTAFGFRALEKNEKYKCFEGKKLLFENFGIKTSNKNENDFFPFLKELHISSKITDSIVLKYENIDIQLLDVEETDLIKRLNLQSESHFNIYQAETTNRFRIESEKVDVKLYLFENQYYPLIFVNGILCSIATNLLNNFTNENIRDLKIEWGLFLRLMNDPNAVLDYNALYPFEDIIDFNKIIIDTRLVWEDEKLFNFLTNNDDANILSLVSNYCPTNIIQKHINDIEWDWIALSHRMDGCFICENPTLKWDFEIISSRDDISIDEIKSLLPLPELKEVEWNWDNIMPKLDFDFIAKHIVEVDFDLVHLTKNECEEVKNLISSNPSKRWNWKYISENYNLTFILDNIHKFVYQINAYTLNRLNLKTIIERAFTSDEYSQIYCSSANFKNTIHICRTALTDFSVNSANYIWNFSTIDFFENNGLLTWSSGYFTDGFECNHSVEWTEDYFNRYHRKVSTEKGFTYVSKSIKSSRLVFDNQNFAWDWVTLSSNQNLTVDDIFVKHFIDRLDLKTLLPQIQSTLIESLFFDYGLKDLLSDNIELWTIATQKVSVEFVRKNLNYNWNWKILTRRFYSTIKIDNLGNERWVDKWDWNFLTRNLDWNVIYENIDNYCIYWDWEYLIDSKLSKKDMLVSAHRIATLDIETQKKLWKSITSKFEVAELTDLIHRTKKLKEYHWDYELFYSLPSFDVLPYIENYTEDVEWHELSKSPQLNRELQWDTLYSKDFWIKSVSSLLKNEKYEWDFGELSKLESVNSRAKFLSIRTQEWDWQYLTANSALFKAGEYFEKIFEQFITYIDFAVLSARRNSGVTQELIKKYSDKPWDWAVLSQNVSIKFDISFVKNFNDKSWDWKALTNRNDITLDNESLYELMDKDWDWQQITNRRDIVFDETLVEKLLMKNLNWFEVSRQNSFVPNQKTLSLLRGKELDWESISKNPNLDNAVLWDYRDSLKWKYVTKNKIDCKNIAQLEKYKNYVDWAFINQCDNFVIDNEILEEFSDEIDWNKASQSMDIDFTEELIDKYRSKWNWVILSDNQRIKEKLDSDFSKYKSEFNGINFIKRFPVRTPYAYHFTHLFNAVDIIKSRKILSRNRAEGKFANAAGNLVDRRSTAHAFARFYYRPQTPTQFYNECLGWDSLLQTSWGKSYYDNACRLGLPKCPMPVFFRFDLSEIISQMPDKCYYSTGNMQTNWAIPQKVSDNPNGLNTKYVYSTIRDGIDIYKNFSQQEFLVLDELDFSTLHSFEIICYNNAQADILKQLLGDDDIKDKIKSYSQDVFHRNNREISFVDKKDTISISSNYKGEAHFEIQCDDKNCIKVPNANVIKETSTTIFAYPSFALVKSDTPIEVRFVDESNRSWIIFKKLNYEY